MRSRLLLSTVASSLLLAGIASAQTVQCPSDADIEWKIQACKNAGYGAEVAWDRYKCKYVVCKKTESSSSGNTSTGSVPDCSKAKAYNAEIALTCPSNRIMRSLDEQKCEWWKCAEQPVVTDPCAGVNQRNESVKQTCPPERLKSEWKEVSGQKCEVLWCEKELDCGKLRARLSELNASSEEYAKLKQEWVDRCGGVPPGKVIDCKKEGCSVRCEDGTLYNVCESVCVQQPTESTAPGLVKSPGRCKTTFDGKCRITRCSDGTTKRSCLKR
ncbi:MAG: hypothetical protein G01um101425_1041 [Candidatus Peregrinibacteria bacterium Gr01-1014_25]|nr:MAG: hypothetical protein G01um101425_1041 [Candidatus Peregrinibacteria bacterium Gr01-1014_25]